MLRRARIEQIGNADLIVETNYHNSSNYIYDVESTNKGRKVHGQSTHRKRFSLKSFPKRIILYIIALAFIFFIIKSTLYNLVLRSREHPISTVVGAPPDVSKRFEEFFVWANENGAELSSKVRIAWYGESYGIGMMAVNNIKEGDRIVNIPKRSVFSISHEKLVSKELIEYISKEMEVDRFTLTSIAFLVEWMNPNSFWTPFFKTFSFPMNPMYWSVEDLNLIDNPQLQLQNYTLIRNKLEKWETIKSYIQKTNSSLFKRVENISTNDMVWSLNVMLQRGLEIDHEWMLIPYLDCMNNALLWNYESMKYDDINKISIGDGYNGYLSHFAFGGYKKGEQLVINYSLTKPSTDYFFGNGFVTENNKNNFILLRSSPLDDLSIRKQILDELDDENKYFLSEISGGLSDSFLRSVYVSLATVDELQNFEGQLDIQQKRLAKSWVMKSLISVTETWNTKLEEDLKVAKDKYRLLSMSSFQRTSFMFRIELKQFMYKMIYMISPNKSASFANDIRKESFIPSYDIQVQRHK